MASNRLTFLLDGRDHLSRVLDRAGDHADRLGRRLLAASINGDAAMRRLSTTTATRMAGLQRDTDLGEKALSALKGTLISLAPAAIPAAASLAPIAAGAGAAAVAMAAFGAALGPQIAGLTEAGEAEKKWQTAIEDGGESSQAAIDAQLAYQKALLKLPPASQRAALALSSLKDEYKGWSDALAADTMPVFTKGLAVAGALLPKTTGLVKGASVQLDRLMTIVAGGMESPGLDGLNKRFTAFATGTLQRVNDQLIRLMRTTDTGKIGGGLSEFMDYARAQGPVVADTLRNVGTALINVLRAGSDVGVGMLDLVNALTGIVSAVPPGAIAAVLQLAVAIKAVKLAAIGMAAARTAMAAFGTQLVAMQVAAAAAPGRLAAVTAAIGAMSRGAKLALAGTGIGLLLIALTELSANSKKAPPDVDKLTTSLKIFADTGKVSGEAARAFGRDLSGLGVALQKVTDPKGLDKFQQSIISFFGTDSTPVKDAKENIDAFDKSLAGLVSSGNAKLAATALQDTINKLESQGKNTSKLRAQLDDYKSALADQAFEQRLAAQAMGLFGAQAQTVQTKLDAQKTSADGLSQSINALSNAVLTARGGIRGMEAALDAADEAFKKNGRTLDENTAKGRGNNQALDDIAASTIKAAESARANGASWATVNGIYDRGHAKILSLTEGVKGNEAAAKKLADQILRTPDKTARLKGNLEDLESKLATAKSKLGKVPDSRRAAIRADIADLQSKIAAAQAKLGNFNGSRATAYIDVQTRYTNPTPGPYAGRYVFGKANGGLIGYASGGMAGFPGGGPVSGPGSSTSDSILARLSNNEYVIKAKSVAKYGVAFMNALNEGRLSLATGIGGGGGAMAGAGLQVGRGLSEGMTASATGVDAAARKMAAAVTAGVRAELEIASPSKKMKALMADVGKGIIVGLTGTKAKISATAKDLVKDIWKAWEGTKYTRDSKLVAMVNKDTKKLQTLASQRDALASKIATAKKYAGDVTSAARQDASLGGLGLAAEDVTAGSIQGGLQAKLAKIKTFTSYIGTLAKRGLSKTLIRQILDMGPEQGYAYASALAGASSSTLKSINSTQSQISKATTKLGQNGADILYDSGKQAGKGFLKGLESQQDAIEKQMVKIARGMDKAIRKALGIKSPSTVGAVSGGFYTKGVAKGAVDALPVMDRAMATVSGRMVARPVIGRPAVAGGGATGNVINLNVTFPGLVVDRIGTAKEIQKLMAELARNTGQPVKLGVIA